MGWTALVRPGSQRPLAGRPEQVRRQFQAQKQKQRQKQRQRQKLNDLKSSSVSKKNSLRNCNAKNLFAQNLKRPSRLRRPI